MSTEKRARFIRIAENRTKKIIKMIRLLSNCSNKTAYDYSDEEVKKIFRAIEAELKLAKSKFSDNQDDTFTLK